MAAAKIDADVVKATAHIPKPNTFQTRTPSNSRAQPRHTGPQHPSARAESSSTAPCVGIDI